MPLPKPCPRCRGTGVMVGKRGPKSKIDMEFLQNLVAGGCSNAEIAGLMGISRQTVWTARKKLTKRRTKCKD